MTASSGHSCQLSSISRPPLLLLTTVTSHDFCTLSHIRKHTFNNFILWCSFKFSTLWHLQHHICIGTKQGSIKYLKIFIFWDWPTKNLNDVDEGFLVLAKGLVLSIAFHLQQAVFKGHPNWIKTIFLICLVCRWHTSSFPGVPALKLRSEVTDAPPLLSVLAWEDHF